MVHHAIFDLDKLMRISFVVFKVKVVFSILRDDQEIRKPSL